MEAGAAANRVAPSSSAIPLTGAAASLQLESRLKAASQWPARARPASIGRHAASEEWECSARTERAVAGVALVELVCRAGRLQHKTAELVRRALAGAGAPETRTLWAAETPVQQQRAAPAPATTPALQLAAHVASGLKANARSLAVEAGAASTEADWRPFVKELLAVEALARWAQAPAAVSEEDFVQEPLQQWAPRSS